MQKYHSLDVMQVYIHGDYRVFFPSSLDAHVVPGANGHLQPLHQIGGPLLWLIPFMLWGRAGALAFMITVSLLTLINIYHFLRERHIDAPYAFVVTLALAIGSPIYVFAPMSFVEPIGTLAVIFALRAVLMERLGPARLVVASTGLALSPWVHMRFAPFAVILGLLLLWRVWRDHRRQSIWPYVQCLAPLVLSVALIEIFTIARYGSVDPMAPQTILGASVFDVPLAKGLSGTLFDRKYGLITNFPVFLLVLPGLLLTLNRAHLRLNVILMAVIVPYTVMSTTFTMWWGAYNPPARFISVLVPVFAYYIAVVLQRVNGWFATGTAVLLGAAAYALAVCSDIFPKERFAGPDNRNHAMERLGDLIGIRFATFTPSSFQDGQIPRFIGWTVATLIIGFIFWGAGRWSDLPVVARHRQTRAIEREAAD